MPRQTISRFPKGIAASPGHEDGSWEGAEDALNIEINKLGRPELREGYIVDNADVFGDGDQLAKVHYIGNSERAPFSKIFRFQNDETWVSDNGRIFIAGDSSVVNRWIDVAENTVYLWENPGLQLAPIRVDDPTDLTLRDGLREARKLTIGDGTAVALAYSDINKINALSRDLYLAVAAWDKYAICMTYYSQKFNIETPPLSARTFDVEFEARSPNNRRNVSFHVYIDEIEAPEWADTLRFYISKTPIATRGQKYEPIPSNEIRFVSRDVVLVRDLSDVISTEFTLVRSDVRQANGSFQNSAGYYGIVMALGWTVIGYDEDAADGSKDLYRSYLEPLEYSTYQLLGNDLVGNPPKNLSNLLLYAGRIWGYDRDTNSVRFSLIDGNGISNYDVFPYENTHLPHALTFVGGWQSTVTHMSVIPGDGGIYVFFRDAIRTIIGRALLKGLYSPEISPQTDLDASGGIEGFGTLSPRSVVEFRNVTIFLGSDRTLYQLVGVSLPKDFGLAIQPYLDDISDNDLEKVTAFGYNDKYHLILRSGVFVLDIKRKYWTRYDIPIVDAYWSSGGISNESILYGLKRNNV